MVVRGNPVPVVCPSTATPSTKVPQPFQWTRAELAARGAGPGLIPRPPQLPPLPLLQRKPLARSTRRLTVTPGPCYRPRESAGLRGDSQGNWTKEEATLPSARYERSSTKQQQQLFSSGSHPSAANENRTCWRRQQDGKGAPEAPASSQRRLLAGGCTASASPGEKKKKSQRDLRCTTEGGWARWSVCYKAVPHPCRPQEGLSCKGHRSAILYPGAVPGPVLTSA